MLALVVLTPLHDRGGALRACGRLASDMDAHAQTWWQPAQREALNETKRKITAVETGSCTWDCANRATMLEPLAADVLMNNVPGDFLEAGVASGGISIFMAAMLRVAV